MNSYALALLLLGSTPNLENGSLLILEGNNKPVRAFTDSEVTHVAIFMRLGTSLPVVFEATPAKVRCVALRKFMDEIRQHDAGRGKSTRVWMMQPKRPYSQRELRRMNSYLNSQLGRRYSVKGYVRHREADGIHCAEFASTALTHTGRFAFRQRYAIDPGELVQAVKTSHESPVRISVPNRRADPTWSKQTWLRLLDFQNWCGWACYEALRFYW